MTSIRQCVYCGRTGTRQFVALGLGGWICNRPKACRRRRGVVRVTRKGK